MQYFTKTNGFQWINCGWIEKGLKYRAYACFEPVSTHGV